MPGGRTEGVRELGLLGGDLRTDFRTSFTPRLRALDLAAMVGVSVRSKLWGFGRAGGRHCKGEASGAVQAV